MDKTITKSDLFLFTFVFIEMIWAAIMIYKPTLAAEPAEKIIITKTLDDAVTDITPVPQERVENVFIHVDRAAQPETTLEYKDKALIARLVNAEATGEDMIGKRLVVDVILNRLDSGDYGETIDEVISERGQFTRPAEEYTSDDIKAVELELIQRLDYEVFYFRTDKYHVYGKPLYQHGSHYFSGKDGEQNDSRA